MPATYKSEVVGAVKRSSGRVPSKYTKSLFSLLCKAMWCNGTSDFAVERFFDCTSWQIIDAVIQISVLQGNWIGA